MTSLRAGEWVEVRSKEEILATLDTRGCLDNLPFMPEMFEHCGKRFRVRSRAHKTCDTVDKTGGRWMRDAVHLDEIRCDGSAHGGCGALCLVFWKEAWLRRAEGSGAVTVRVPARECTDADVRAATRATAPGPDDDPTYSCQATMLPRATTPLPWWDVRQYLEDFFSGNNSSRELLGGAAYVACYEVMKRVEWRSGALSRRLIGAYDLVQALFGGVPYPRKRGTIPAGQKTPSRPLGLRPGDLVRVRTHLEILGTLDTNNKNRGMYFDAEEVPYCGKTFRVRSNVTKIINERTGKMLALKGENVILDGVYCKGWYSDRRMFCPRAIYPIWRETWLERAGDENAP
jgi:hypothetical protein